MDEKEKAKELKEKFGDLSNLVIDEILDNTNVCISRYKSNYDMVCIRQYWLGVRDNLIDL